MMEPNTIFTGDVMAGLAQIADKTVNCVVTSPPYWNLRDYGMVGQLGLEKTPEEYIVKLVSVFRDVRRVLRDDGVIWVNIGDSYASYWGSKYGHKQFRKPTDNLVLDDPSTVPSKASPIFAKHRPSDPATSTLQGGKKNQINALRSPENGQTPGYKPKDLIGIPWMLAFALRADGWFLRQDIIWNKENPMPESVTGRCTKSHEYIFMLSKHCGKALCWQAQDSLEWVWVKPDLKERMANGRRRWEGHDYYYDRHAIKTPIKTPIKESSINRLAQDVEHQNGSDRVPFKTNGNMKAVGGGQANIRGFRDKQRGHSKKHEGFNARWDHMTKKEQAANGANKRSVWTVPTLGISDAHFATFPPMLIVDCIKAGCPANGTVLDPFLGAGTSAIVTSKLNRNYLGIELNPKYVTIAQNRLYKELGMFL